MKNMPSENTHTNENTIRNNHIAFFSTRPYEQVVFSQLLENHNKKGGPMKAAFFVGVCSNSISPSQQTQEEQEQVDEVQV